MEKKTRQILFSSILIHILQRDEMVHAPSAASSSWSNSPFPSFFFFSLFPWYFPDKGDVFSICKLWPTPTFLSFSFPSVDEHTVKEHFILFPPITSFLLPSSYSFPGDSQTKMMSFPYINYGQLQSSPLLLSFRLTNIRSKNISFRSPR